MTPVGSAENEKIRSDLLSQAKVSYEQEVRLAVVMYGGVSLAIYINGVAQELLRLVHATAPSRSAEARGSKPFLEKLTRLEEVYRELGCRLGLTNDCRPLGTHAAPGIRTRFVVDVISGTSAGGINGVFLAKALVRMQTMEQLKDLWMTEADLRKLLNDAQSVRDLEGRVELQKKPKSLLNSQRMYLKLLAALRQMKSVENANPSGASPLADELDLFVTATDIHGLVVRLRLADKMVYERRYRNVFHFLFATAHGSGSEHDDFVPDNDPFLAYAARCTSSFPAAFEPMTLEKITEVQGSLPTGKSLPTLMDSEWRRFFADYLPSQSGSDPKEDREIGPFELRPFGDGGYLDNKPFSYAIDALRNRRVDLPLRRKLLYVEPSPEHPELDRLDLSPPDAIENLVDAASRLPRQETIREDLERILERNQLIEHVDRATRYMGGEFDLDAIARKDAAAAGRAEPKPALSPGAEWARKSLREQIAVFGGAYGAYHRLKVSEVTGDIADLACRVLGLDERSDESLALRYLVSAWRQAVYTPNRPAATAGAAPSTRATENAFLLEFDLSYRMRRLAFVRNRITLLLREEHHPRHAPDILAGALGRKIPWPVEDPAARARVGEELRRLQTELGGILAELRAHGRGIRAREKRSPLYDAITRTGFGWADLKAVMKPATAEGRIAAAQEILRRPAGAAPVGDRAASPAASDPAEWAQPPFPRGSRMFAFDAAAEQLAGELRTGFDKASEATRALLDRPGESGPMADVRLALWRSFLYFDYFDLMLFPMILGTDIGEICPVEVLRISPEDSTSLLSERDPDSHRMLCPKLAGTRLGNFGGFLDRVWRQSDILWGRLDASERLIRTLFDRPAGGAAPGDARGFETTVEDLVARAQVAILDEELGDLSIGLGRRVFVEAWLHTVNGEPDFTSLSEAVARLSPYVRSLGSEHLKALFDPDRLKSTYESAFQSGRTLAPERALRLAARGSQVMGGLLDGLSERYDLIQKKIPWLLIVLGRILWGWVEISVPRSLFRAVASYWINLLYLSEFLLWLGGLVTSTNAWQQVALMLFALTILVDVGRRWLGAALAARPDRDFVGRKLADATTPRAPRRHPLLVWLGRLALIVVVALTVFGAIQTWNLIGYLLQEARANRTALIVTLVVTVAMFVGVPFCGWIADRIERKWGEEDGRPDEPHGPKGRTGAGGRLEETGVSP